MAKIKSKQVPKSSKLKKAGLKKTKSKENKLKKSKPFTKKLKTPISESDFTENDSFNEELLNEQYEDSSVLDGDDEIKSVESFRDESDEDEATKHKKDLEKLKVSDPEFYKFLQENDKKLLQFNVSDDEQGDMEEVEDVHVPSEGLDVASDESDFEVSKLTIKSNFLKYIPLGK